MEIDDREREKNKYQTIITIIVTAFLTFFITAFVMYEIYIPEYGNTKDNAIQYIIGTSEGNKNFSNKLESKLSIVKKCLEKNYLEDLPTDDKLLDSAVKGYVDGLGDEYTEYLSQEDYKELMIDVNGNFVGIGIYMSQDRYGDIIVLMPMENSPALEAGIQTGDIIVKVNGEKCNGVETSIIANKIKGEEGTSVDLEILRDEETLTKTITRRSVQINYVKSDILDNNIGYIKISAFDDGCSTKFKEKLDELTKKNIKSLVIDVRDNGGGIVTEVLSIAEMLLDKNKIMMVTVDKEGKEETIISENKDSFNGKIVLLVNENSASASEILASALQDNDVATLVGTTTYGKGVMQEIVPLPDGSALKITIEEFRTPNGNKINIEGIKPSVEIEDDNKTEQDEQLNKAKAILDF